MLNKNPEVNAIILQVILRRLQFQQNDHDIGFEFFCRNLVKTPKIGNTFEPLAGRPELAFRLTSQMEQWKHS
jgi:hypothetical protein